MNAVFPAMRQSVIDRLQRLRGTLDSLGQQLRDSIASAVSKAVADAVCEGMRGLLGSTQQSHPPPDYHRWSREEPHQRWDQPRTREYDPWADTGRGYLPDNEFEDEPYQRDPYQEPEEDTPSSSQTRLQTWLSALAAGWRVGLWWLQRQKGKFPVLTTLGVGLAAGLATLAVGPVAVAGISAVGAILGLTALADSAQSSTAALAGAATQ